MINEGNVIKPSDGMVLTNGDIYATLSIRLGDGDIADNYHEITKEEYEAILQKQEELNDEITDDEFLTMLEEVL